MKKRNIRTCMSSMILPPMEVKLYHSQHKMKRDLKSRGVIYDEAIEGHHAFTVNATIDDGTFIGFVCITPKSRKWKYEQALSLLAHEAYHVVEGYLDRIGESVPASEEMAYLLQSASEMLFCEHRKWVEAKE